MEGYFSPSVTLSTDGSRNVIFFLTVLHVYFIKQCFNVLARLLCNLFDGTEVKPYTAVAKQRLFETM